MRWRANGRDGFDARARAARGRVRHGCAARMDFSMQRQRDASATISNAELIGKRSAGGARRSAVVIRMTALASIRHHEESFRFVSRAPYARRTACPRRASRRRRVVAAGRRRDARARRTRRQDARVLLRRQPGRLRSRPAHDEHRFRCEHVHDLQRARAVQARHARSRAVAGDELGRVARPAHDHVSFAARREVPDHRVVHADATVPGRRRRVHVPPDARPGRSVPQGLSGQLPVFQRSRLRPQHRAHREGRRLYGALRAEVARRRVRAQSRDGVRVGAVGRICGAARRAPSRVRHQPVPGRHGAVPAAHVPEGCADPLRRESRLLETGRREARAPRVRDHARSRRACRSSWPANARCRCFRGRPISRRCGATRG